MAAPAVVALAFLLAPTLEFDRNELTWDLLLPFVRSSGLGATTMFLSGMLGIPIGWALASRRISPRVAAWLIAPFCLGGAAWGVLFYPLIDNIPGIDVRSTFSVYSTLIAVNVIQYGTLIGFIAYHSFAQTLDDTEDARSALRLSAREAARLLYWPRCRAVILFTCLVVYCCAMAEHDRALIYFKPSSGTGTQLFSHALNELYIRRASSGHGTSAVISNALVGTIASGILVSALLWVAAFVLRLAFLASVGTKGVPARTRGFPTGRRKDFNWLFPLFFVALLASGAWSAIASDGLVFRALFYVGVAALLISVFYIGYACILRIHGGDFWERRRRWRKVPVGSFFHIPLVPARDLFTIGLVSIRIVPAIVINYVVLVNTVALEGSSEFIRISAWLIAHLVYNAAIILPFLIMLLFGVSKQEIHFLRSAGVSLMRLVNLSFLKRFPRDMALVVVFVFVLVWNGDAINVALSSTFDSANTEIVVKLTSRNYSPMRVLELLIPTIAAAGLAVCLVAESSARVLGRQSRRLATRPVFAMPAVAANR